MGKYGRRMLTKEELLNNARKINEMKKARYGASFAVAALSSNYVLWKNEKFYPKILVEYNTKVREYYDNFDTSKVDEYNQVIFDKCEFMVEVEQHMPNSKAKNQSYKRKMSNLYGEIDNDIILEFQKYMICHYLTLIDMSYGCKRLNRINENILGLYNNCVNENKQRIGEIRQELEEYGVYIEFPYDDIAYPYSIERA